MMYPNSEAPHVYEAAMHELAAYQRAWVGTFRTDTHPVCLNDRYPCNRRAAKLCWYEKKNVNYDFEFLVYAKYANYYQEKSIVCIRW